MSKIIVLECTTDFGEREDLVFVGNEYSRDPLDILQLVHKQFKSSMMDDELELEDVTISSTTQGEVVKLLNKNGYQLVKPKRIVL